MTSHTNSPSFWRSPPPPQTWILLLLGVPIASGFLLVTQANWQSIETWYHRSRNPLEAPYRYPFEATLGNDRRPIARLQQEIAAYQERLRQDPNRAIEQVDLATAYLSMARTTGESSWFLLAEQAAQRSLAVLPTDNSSAVLVLARVAEARHDFTEALRLAQQVPYHKDAIATQVTSNLALGNLAAARRAATQLVDLTLSANAFLLQGLVQMAQGEDQAALQSFHHALKTEESGTLMQSARIRTTLGRFYYERGQLDLAQNLYNEALYISPDYVPAKLNLAQLAIRQAHYGTAAQYYTQIANATPTPTVFTPLLLRGQAQLKALQSDRPGAEQAWRKAEELLRENVPGASPNPANSTTSPRFGHRRDLARLLLERGHPQDIREALTLMQAEVKLRQDADTLDTLAWALLQSKRWTEAQQAIQAAIALGSRDANLFHRAGTIEQALGNTNRAKTYFEQALATDPQFGDRARQASGLGVRG